MVDNIYLIHHVRGKATPLSLRTGRKGKENSTFSLQKHPVLLQCAVLPVNFVMSVLVGIAWCLQGKVIEARKAVYMK